MELGTRVNGRLQRLKWALALTLLLAVAAVASAQQTTLAHPGYLVSAKQLMSEQGSAGLLVLDVRDSSAYRSGHIPGAVNLPLSELQHSVRLSNGNESPAIVKPARQIRRAFRSAGIDASSRIVIYDGGVTYLSTRVWWMLDYYGHAHIAILNGGLPAWKAAGGRVSTASVRPRQGSFRPVPDPNKIATYSYVEAHIGTTATSICDALSASSYRSGAIRGSLNVPWSETLQSSAFGGFKEANQLASLLESAGLHKNSNIIFYCQRGYVSSVEYFVARALGYTHVRLYDGSLSDFTAHGGKLVPSGRR